jgi:hypothetical protein
MNTLTIKDLSVTEQLDSKSMKAVRGGAGNDFMPPMYFNFMSMYAPNNSRTVYASQLISTTMNIQNGNNTAFVTGATNTFDPHVSSSNNIYMPN